MGGGLLLLIYEAGGIWQFAAKQEKNVLKKSILYAQKPTMEHGMCQGASGLHPLIGWNKRMTGYDFG